MKYRIGFGYDVHPLAEGRTLWLGGVQIPHKKGCVGHSDADVLLHAICDALLGALNLRDIGYHFPNTNPEYAGIDSKKLLQKVFQLVQIKGYKIGNIDATLCAEKPKINPYIPSMQHTIAEILQVSVEDISIKATTNEKLGFIGREEGITAYAVVLVYKQDI
ncbi:MAG: 2-C-methyl-D-erythritol 2,4-cyclodiphosphate synthase [Bacteroidia bacterium]|nr:2-C-methyl-D-erythritol 2,4-cyclodiphosphate synthase [Bacteroidia bacterium]MDW8345553.1 2-C-methyl-D-erythritol 2,4-cyclodiphosphate synthase [Bacteroidia bacterium]